jgi:GT2 family glycosyltransferase
MRVLKRWFSFDRSGAPNAPGTVTAAIPTRRYRAWVRRYDTLEESDRVAIRAHLSGLSRRPLVSILIAANDEQGAEGLRRSLQSLAAQLYDDWEACIAGDAGNARSIASADPRVRIVEVSRGRSEAGALNAALAAARGDFVAILDPGDRLSEYALYSVAAELDLAPMSDVVYSDEDFFADSGERCWPHFKPDWDPDLALGLDLLGRLCVMRASVVRALGGFREEFEPAAQYDLRLRLTHAAGADRIRHVPAVLYHRCFGQSAPRDFSSAEYTEAAREAVWRHCRAHETAVIAVEPAPRLPFWNRVIRTPPDPEPLVSAIVPTRDRADLLRACAEGVLARTDYRAIELIILDNDSAEPETAALFEELRRDPRVRVIEVPGRFNFSAMVNQGASAARGDILLLLNNDIEVLNPLWLGEMVSQALRPEIGAVGARLLFPNGNVQHSGVILTPEPNAYHALRHSRGDDPGYYGQLALTRTYLAVTGACLAIRREVFEEVGGLDEQHLAVTSNDIDLCLRIGARGYRVICTPRAELMHHESATRGSDARGANLRRARTELAHAVSRAEAHYARDKYANPNLSYTHDGYVVLSKPRVARPWRANEKGTG